MKIYILFLISVISFSSTKPTSEVGDKIISAIKNGNAAGIAKHFNNKIDLKVLDKEDVFSDAQAETVLKDFFSKHRVNSYSITHSNDQKNGTEFISGNLVTNSGKFRISFLIKKIDAKYLISQFRIENEKN